jgi:hypothetical protein
MFKPLKLPHHLHPYPPYSFKYLPWFFGEDHVTNERHLEAFENFFYHFKIVHDDVTMRLFSQYLFGDVVVWFKCLGDGSIGSWTELCTVFFKFWAESKSLDQYWFEFNALRRGKEEALVVFSRRFYNVYHSMHVEIRPIDTVAMFYYVMAHHLELVLLLRERKYSSLRHLFEDAREFEENIRARKGVNMPPYLEKLHVHKKDGYQYISNSEQEDSGYELEPEQQQGSECGSHAESDSSIFVDFSMGRNAYQSYDKFSKHVEHEVLVDCIDDYMLLVGHNHEVLNPVVQLSYGHPYEGETSTIDDQALV